MVINLFKDRENRWKLLYTAIMLAIAVFLTQLPVYGINSAYLEEIFSSSNVLGFMDSLSGGSISNLSVAGFGITSYITGSIILQLLGVAIPKLEKIKKDGEHGRKIFKKIEITFAMVLTLAFSIVLSVGFGKNGLFIEYSAKYVILAIVCWMIGTFVIVYLGKKNDDYGIGNGISLILIFNILSRIPSNFVTFYEEKMKGQDASTAFMYGIGMVAALFIFYLVTVYLQSGSLNIPIKQSRKSASRMNTDGRIPMGVNIANVLPVIYASTLVSFPLIIQAFFDIEAEGKAEKILSIFASSNWYTPTEWYQVFGLVIYIALIAVFGLFSSMLTFNTAEVADHMKKNGNVIPGINPGEDTIKYLERRRKIMSCVNVIFLIVVATIPDLICAKVGITQFTFLGTSLIIIVNVLFDTSLRLKAAAIHNDKKLDLF